MNTVLLLCTDLDDDNNNQEILIKQKVKKPKQLDKLRKM